MEKKLKMFTINELAELLNVSQKTIRRHISSGKIESTRVGGVHRISKKSLTSFLNPDKVALASEKLVSNSKLEGNVPSGKMEEKWGNHKRKINLVSPANKRLIDIIVVGTGLAGASASATLAELGYNVKSFCIHF